MAMLPCHLPCLPTLLTGRPKCTTTTTTSFMLGSSVTSSMILKRMHDLSKDTARIQQTLERSKEEHEHWMSKEQKKLQKMVDKAKQKQLIRDWKDWWRNKKAWSSCQAQGWEDRRAWRGENEGMGKWKMGDRRRWEMGNKKWEVSNVTQDSIQD
ncbi:uncharacterized protein BJ212DRAFT_1300414 [Suillus subaureus]|uniref:Uncharacterized protein n=1 Tax=Suillus subaureus TaxID=48587 RepID=A0A9P7JCH3_9AGAM|nr:uncharacterized protein BJ212DRAFT_1300414 [Suillus subaureus]KAG1814597.1 hypothetical protein BJ212DRAFT_1300414 [Suillus subaureus]